MHSPLEDLYQRIEDRGGFVNAHAHLDRAYTLTKQDISNNLIYSPLEMKWLLVDDIKQNLTQKEYEERMMYAVRMQAERGVRTILSFIDIDPLVELKAIRATEKVKQYANEVHGVTLLTASQTLKGLNNSKSQKLLEKALSENLLDVIGSLPRADQDLDRHFDTLFSIARSADLPIHCHVDQNNTPIEKETELLITKTKQYKYSGRVTAIHSISLATHPKKYRHLIYKMAQEVNMHFVSCPTAWIDHKRNETQMPFHYALTPVDEMLEYGLIVGLGTDNIQDLYKPFCDGDMKTELRLLLEGNKIYDSDKLLDIATTNGMICCEKDKKVRSKLKIIT